jgi:hypothetical protein
MWSGGKWRLAKASTKERSGIESARFSSEAALSDDGIKCTEEQNTVTL